MLHESSAIAQVEDQPLRRWFFDDEVDLLVWFDEQGRPTGFQLIYPTPRGPHVLTRRPSGFLSHNSIDTGSIGGFPWDAAPLLAADGKFDGPVLLADFKARSNDIDPAIAAFVVDSVIKYAARDGEVEK